MLKSTASAVLFSIFCLSAEAQYVPSWWLDNTNPVLVPGAVPNNFAPVSAGQLKWIALRAKNHLDITLAGSGGAGAAIDTLIGGFPATKNYRPVNLGQLKAVAKPFYDRLNAVGYSTNQNLIANGYPAAWPYNYPWNPNDFWNSTSAGSKPQNYKPINLGQLKLAFSFDVVDTNENGTFDYLEGIYPALNLTRDTDEDGIYDYYDAYPNDPNNGVVIVPIPGDTIPPTITITRPSGTVLTP